MTNEPRTIRLRKWMANNNVTFRWVGDQLNITATGARNMLIKDTIPVERHQRLMKIGVPADLLPVAMDIPTGPARKEPSFSALAAQ